MKGKLKCVFFLAYKNHCEILCTVQFSFLSRTQQLLRNHGLKRSTTRRGRFRPERAEATRGGRFRPERAGAVRRAGGRGGTTAHYRAEPCRLSRRSVGGSTSMVLDFLV